MPNLLRSLTRSNGLTLSDYVDAVYSGIAQGIPALNQTITGHLEEPPTDFASLVQMAYQSNGVVFACMLARQMLFSEARFQFQQMRAGRPGNLFGTAALAPLEKPWPNGNTGDLLSRAIQDADAAGNFYGVRRRNGIRRMFPHWVTIVLGSHTDPEVQAGDIDAEIIAFLYHRGGRYSGSEPEILMPDEVVHFAPIPDPLASFRGMSWLTPVMREVMGDTAMSQHKIAFMRNGATPNMVVSLDIADPVKFEAWIAKMEAKHKGVRNAYRTLYLGAGAKVEPVGANMQQIDFKLTQGAGETRIAAAAGIHPVILGLSEGLAGSSLNAGNFQAAARLTADKTLRPLWRNMAGSLEDIIQVPVGSRLWYDDRDIAFLRADIAVLAETQKLYAETIVQLTNAGFEPTTAMQAVIAGDMNQLVHTGLVSVQLQPPGTPLLPARATADFWPSSGPFAEQGIVRAGSEVPGDHALVRAFPSMFEPAEPRLQLTTGEVRCPNGHKVANRLAPGSEVVCQHQNCKAIVAA